MNYRFLSVTSDILSEIMNYLVFVTVWAFVNALMDLEDRPLLMVGFVLVPLFFYFVRIKVDGFFFFTFLHIIVPVIGAKVFGRTLGEEIVIGFVLGGIAVVSYVVSIKCDEPGAPVVNPALAAVLMFAGLIVISMASPDRTVFIPKLALLFAGLYMPHMYLEKLMWFDYINSKTVSDVPTAESLKVGGPLVCGLSLFYMGAAFLCLNETLINKLSSSIGNFIRRFLAWLLSGVQAEEEEQLVEESSSGIAGGFETGMLIEEETEEPSALGEALAKIAIYGVLIAASAALLVIIGILIYEVYKRLKHRERHKKIKLTDDYVEVREKVKRQKSAKEHENTEEGPYAVRIRKLYKKMIKKNPQLSESPELLTAREFALLFEKDKQDHAGRFARIYEKARYSAAECTKYDYNEAKRFASTLF